MNDIKIMQDLTMITILRHNLVDIRNGAVCRQIESAIEQDFLCQSNLQQKIVFNTLCEGHGPREMQAVLDSLAHLEWAYPHRIVFLHNSLDEPRLPIKHVAWPWYMVNHSNWLDNLRKISFDWQHHIKDQWFICLMRRPSQQRSRLLKFLLSNFSPTQYRLSYASILNYQDIDHIAKVKIPILLDGPTPGNEQHCADDPRIFGCLINLVVETSCQEDGDHYWSSAYLSEKTFKCFGWRQLPLWFAAPGHVAGVRTMGFDVFDDIFDHHCYDSVINPGDRMLLVMEILKKFLDQHKLVCPNDLYKKFQQRIDKNYRRLLELDAQKLSHWSKILDKCRELYTNQGDAQV
jgi:hypothetical protein